MARAYPEWQGSGIEVWAIAPDPPEALARYWSTHGLPFRGASDPSGRVLAALGQRVNWLRFGRMPALLAIGAEGRIVGAHYGASMQDVGDTESLRRLLVPEDA